MLHPKAKGTVTFIAEEGNYNLDVCTTFRSFLNLIDI
jgi:hypothetical protein